jgi:hypothetical protein
MKVGISGKEFLAKQSEYLAKNDIDGLMREHYHPDAEMVTFEFVLKGTGEIGKYLKVDSPAKSGKILGTEITHMVDSDDTILFTAVVNSEKLGTFVARDALYLEDGKILRHIAMTMPPDEDAELLKRIKQ